MKAVSLGLDLFADELVSGGAEVTRVDWRPPAIDDPAVVRWLGGLTPDGGAFGPELLQANAEVAAALAAATPVLVDVLPARDAIPALREPGVLLHAGPPMAWEAMGGPMRGGCVGALLHEGWADTPDAALRRLQRGEIRFLPCHAAGAVGPMAGITSPSMPVVRVVGSGGGGAHCILNEGIGPVLRFGAFGPEVLQRLAWMRDELGPALGAALRRLGGIPLRPLMGRALAMGDEMHQRNAAATLQLTRELIPALLQGERPVARVLDFLFATDQFFLNVAMAAGKLIGDTAQRVGRGTVVTAMCRNGAEFGIRVSGLGDRWFTAPVNTPAGAYFAGFSAADANPDIGDSAIMETVGLGGMALPASPAVVGFVGAGRFGDALRIYQELAEVVVRRNADWSLPAADFAGALTGIELGRVVETGITPLINTGIAHREAGVGQIGAGTVRAPIGCFTAALRAHCR